MIVSRRNALVALSVAGLCAAVVGAGSITPPAGPVVGTMKTLDEVEPRTAVNAANTPGNIAAVYEISKPGSYYLTENLAGVAGKEGIIITSDNVTLDLNGFTVQGVPGSLNGIATTFVNNVVIRNGIVSGWGDTGVLSSIDYGLIEDLVVTFCANWGVNSDTSSFSTVIQNCVAEANGQVATNAGGISVGDDAVVRDCVATENRGIGIRARNRSVVLNNQSVNNFSNAGAGVVGHGIVFAGGFGRVSNNTVINTEVGIAVTGASNLITSNTVKSGSGNAYNIAASNHALVVSAPLAGAIAGSSGGVSVSADPLANIAY